MTVSTLAPPLVFRTGRRGRLRQLVKRMHSSAAIWPWVIPVVAALLSSACGTRLDTNAEGIALYYAGRRVSLEQSRSVSLRERLNAFFYECRTYQAVTGLESPQDELQELWESEERGDHVLLTGRGAVHPRFGHLQGRTFTMLLSLDPVAGTGQVLTNHDGVVTLYIKCPGMDMMALTCELLSEVSPRDSWPICSRVDEVRNQIDVLRC